MIADGGWRTADSIRGWRLPVDDSFPNPGRVWRSPTVILLVSALIVFSGCNGPQGEGAFEGYGTDGGDGLQIADDAVGDPRPAVHTPQPPTGFGPAKIGILPLTELSGSSKGEQNSRLNVYVTLLDAFGSQIKGPGTLRFELYEYVPRSAQRKGQRIAPARDIDLTRPVENHRYWRDFLRAYEFELDVPADPEKSHVLEVTCVCPEGKRLTSEYLLRGGR